MKIISIWGKQTKKKTSPNLINYIIYSVTLINVNKKKVSSE